MIDQACFNDAMLGGAKEVFETMIFMDLEESSETDQHIEGNALLGSITFTGSLEGCLTICCSVVSAKTIAANMLGMDPSEQLSEEEICDAIGEVANMVMGSVKSRLADSVGDLQVSIPSVVSGKNIVNSIDGASEISINVNIADEYTAELSLLYKEGPE